MTSTTDTDQLFKYIMRVRYSECDAQKVVFNAKYAEYVDLAATEYLRVLLGDYDDIQAQGIDFQVVNLTLDWKASAHYDDVLVISCNTLHVGNTSYRFSFEFFNQTTEQSIMSAHATYVMMDAETMVKKQIDTEIRQILIDGAPNQIINQSGQPYC